MPRSPLFDQFGQRIRRERYFGFGRTPASEPDFEPDREGSVCADAIGFMVELDDAAEIELNRQRKGIPKCSDS